MKCDGDLMGVVDHDRRVENAGNVLLCDENEQQMCILRN